MAQVSLLQKYFGFNNFRSGQNEAVQHILSGYNTLVIMPTGAGKSLIYQYAALALREKVGKPRAVTLVISPLISLMKDQVDRLQEHGITAIYINSMLSVAEQQKRSNDILQGRYALVYVAPERLRQSSFMRILQSLEIQLFVIDEAHCISTWGHDFRPDYRRIAETRQDLGQPLTVALTATATSLVQDDIVELLGMSEARRVVTGFNRPNLSFEVLYTSGTHTKLQELAFLLQEYRWRQDTFSKACIIYTATRKEAEEVASFIAQKLSLPCASYHAGLGIKQRQYIQNAFSKKTLPIVVATNAFGMGIDRSDVRLVVHYQLPGSLEAYYQEAGRAGRDGKPSRAVLLYSKKDSSVQNFLIQQNCISLTQLYKLFKYLQQVPQTMEGFLCSLQDIQKFMGWSQKKLRLALSYLERANILEGAELAESIGSISGEKGILRLVLGTWKEEMILQSIYQIEKYSLHRRKQLGQMKGYAEAESCRRKILLSYFSDLNSYGSENIPALRCCDFCSRDVIYRHDNKNNGENWGRNYPKRFTALNELSRAQRAALIILSSVNQLGQARIYPSRQRIAQMLVGSRSQNMTDIFRSQQYYGRLNRSPRSKLKRLLMSYYRRDILQKHKLHSSSIFMIELAVRGCKALEQYEMIVLQAFANVADC